MVRRCEDDDLTTVRRILLRLLLYRYIQLIMRATEAKRFEEDVKWKHKWWRSVPMAIVVFVVIVVLMLSVAMFGYLNGSWEVQP
jgi:hypothetical protein